MSGHIISTVQPISYDRALHEPVARPLAVEVPIALEYNGIAYAVMMATPIDIEDFAIGFSLSERLITTAAEIKAMDIIELSEGWVVRMELPTHLAEPIRARARLRLVEGSCGLCGIESLEEIIAPLPTLESGFSLRREALGAALSAILAHQSLGQKTGAMHAAAFCAPDGRIILAREDIGRHNALDKILGAIARQSLQANHGFLLLTARCSFELVQKAALAGCSILVTISAPTSMAVERAEACGMTLVSLARHDSALVITDKAGRII